VRVFSSRIRSKRPEAAFLLLGLLACPALPCLAGESFLDRSKVREAVPYGTDVEPAAPHGQTQPTGERHGTGPPDTTSTTLRPGSTQGGRGAPGAEPR
jgi:hypothetical protein